MGGDLPQGGRVAVAIEAARDEVEDLPLAGSEFFHAVPH
jgi:hypothetical protein